MKENINEHDMTKRMMDIIRGGFKTRLITEVDEPTQPTQDVNSQAQIVPKIDDRRDTVEIKSGDAMFEEELKSLTEIDKSATIDSFIIYLKPKQDSNTQTEPSNENVNNENNAIMKGEFLHGLASYTMELNKNEMIINTKPMSLNQKNPQILNMMQGYFENWRDKWTVKITNEFKQTQD